AGLAVLGGLLAAYWTRLVQALALGLGALLALAIAVSLALAGHAATSGLTLATDTVHVLAMSAWLGGLVAVLADALPARRTQAVQRFSTVAIVSVLVLVATGVFQAWRQVGAWGALSSTAYGQDLLVKIVLVLMAVVFAAGSWVMLRRASWAQLRTTVAFEAVALGFVLAVTSALTATQPAKDAWRPEVDRSVKVLGDTVTVSAVPTGNREAELHLYVADRGGRQVEPQALTASVRLPGRSIGPLPVALRVAGTGHRIADVSVPVAGEWQLQVTLRTTAFDEDSVLVDLPLR
ncbi:MAG: CopD family protein, partial [Nocardioides sp.]|nr:CopD family protein [Nocardioides sp.]